jgi:TRAP-type uncharacterized transport system substrate-binding protein
MTFNNVVKELKKQIPELHLELFETKGAEDNLKQLCDGSVDIALVHSSLAPPCEVKAIARMFDSVLHAVADEKLPIQDITDLGKCKAQDSDKPTLVPCDD